MKTRNRMVILLMVLLLGIGLFACATEKSIARLHPYEVRTPVLCSECHKDARASLDHSPDFSTRHGFYAAQQKAACEGCHRESFCSDCHTHKDEIKPSDKYKDNPERTMPHRGDYLSQHMIDGRINPAACFRCHGRNNNRRCLACHR